MGDIVERLREAAKDRAQMERETPGAYPRPPRQHIEWEAADEIAALRAENARLTKQVANLEARGIHSCNDECQRPLCVAQRENARLREGLEKAIETLAASRHLVGKYTPDHHWLPEHDQRISELRSLAQQQPD